MKTRFLLLLAFVFSVFTLSAQSESVLEEVEQMPTFKADCQGNTDLKDCSDRAMLQYVYESVKYPKRAIDASAEGMVVISFIVEKDGTVSHPEVYRDQVGYGAAEEVMRIVKSMNDNGPRWNPGQQDGKTVRVSYKLPVKFKNS